MIPVFEKVMAVLPRQDHLPPCTAISAGPAAISPGLAALSQSRGDHDHKTLPEGRFQIFAKPGLRLFHRPTGLFDVTFRLSSQADFRLHLQRLSSDMYTTTASSVCMIQSEFESSNLSLVSVLQFFFRDSLLSLDFYSTAAFCFERNVSFLPHYADRFCWVKSTGDLFDMKKSCFLHIHFGSLGSCITAVPELLGFPPLKSGFRCLEHLDFHFFSSFIISERKHQLLLLNLQPLLQDLSYHASAAYHLDTHLFFRQCRSLLFSLSDVQKTVPNC